MQTPRNQVSDAVSKRYDSLSKEPCCLSCGGAVTHADVNSGEACVDLGCGKGMDVIRMAIRAGISGSAIGIDISEGMLETAKQNAERAGVSNAVFIYSPLEQINLPEACADVVISNCTINHSLSQGSVWQEIFRILKPGGRFVVSDIYAIEKVADTYRNNPAYISECWEGAETRQAYMKNIAQAGFIRTEVLEESKPYEKGLIKVASFTVKGNKP